MTVYDLPFDTSRWRPAGPTVQDLSAAAPRADADLPPLIARLMNERGPMWHVDLLLALNRQPNAPAGLRDFLGQLIRNSSEIAAHVADRRRPANPSPTTT